MNTRPSFRQPLDAHLALVGRLFAERPDVAHHVGRVARLVRPLGLALDLPSEVLHDLDLGARWHDLGKLLVPEKVLHKTGPLDDDDWRWIRAHPALGVALLARALCPSPRVLAIVLAHHERWDGQGYPHGLRGVAVPLLARIVSVVDAYDALVTRRPYRDARPPEEARAELARHAGTQFDPLIVEAFLSLPLASVHETNMARDGPHDPFRP